MNFDTYTKSVLTVIAMALVVIVIQNSVNSSHAQLEKVTKVQICDALFSTKCLSLEEITGSYLLGKELVSTKTYGLPVAVVSKFN